jgi:hypothetical protein
VSGSFNCNDRRRCAIVQRPFVGDERAVIEQRVPRRVEMLLPLGRCREGQERRRIHWIPLDRLLQDAFGCIGAAVTKQRSPV